MFRCLSLAATAVILIRGVFIDVETGPSRISKHRPRFRRDELQVSTTDITDVIKNTSSAIPGITNKIKYQKFELPEKYNRLQIPTLLLYTTLMGEDTFDDLYKMDLSNDLKVSVTLRIKNINEVNEADEEVTFAADLILEWIDEFILYSSMRTYNIDSVEIKAENRDNLFKTMDAGILKQIWKPDIFFENLVKVAHPEVMSQPVTVRLNEITGEVIYASRLRVQMECELDFHYYPADTQSCEVMMRSNSYSVDELKLEWSDPFGIYLEDCSGANYDYQLTASVHDEEETKHEGYIGNKTREFSILPFAIAARRKLSYHMVQTFLPSLFFIIITWLCFLVPARMVEARIGIAMTTLLTLTAMFASVRESTPSVSYVRAIDIWMIACIFFVFLTLLEFTVVLWLRNTKEELENDKPKGGKDVAIKVEGNEESPAIEIKEPTSKHPETQKAIQDRRQRAERHDQISTFIEKYAFLMFSVIFFLFSLAFWSWLLIGSKYFVWSFSANRDINCPGSGK